MSQENVEAARRCIEAYSRGDYEEDVKNLNPLHIIVVGLIAVVVFVVVLVLLAKWMVAR